MTFEVPLALLALVPVAGWVVWLGRRGFSVVPERQHRWAVWLRVAGVSLLVLALAAPALVRGVDRTTVLFLVDHSASIATAGRAEADAFIDEALAAGDGTEWTGVGVFAADTRVDRSLAPGRVAQPVSAIVTESATDLAGALRAAAATLPTEGSRRIVVLSDALETTGDARAAAAELADAGIAVDIVRLDSATPADALVSRVEAPATARVGDIVPAVVVVESTIGGNATLTVDDGTSRRAVEVDLTTGFVEVPIEVEATESGYLTIGATLDAPGDTRPENDRAAALVRVLGQGSVLVVEGRTGEADDLSAALEAAGLRVERASVLPPEEALLAHDAVVLVNVEAPTASEGERLRAWVEDLGRGLVVIGGDQAFGMGDYAESPIEAILPVSSNPDDLVRRQPVAEVLAIDTSGSMAACHCDEPGGHPDGAGSAGINKTDLSRAGAAMAIDALDDKDLVGVVSFGSGTTWVVPLGPKGEQGDTDAALGSLSPVGATTEIANGLQAAREALAAVDTPLRHIVLFTDGWDPNEGGLLPLAREIAAEGITLSVLGTGEGAGTTLERMADIGGGRYYPGEDLASIPEIFVEETQTVARNLIQEGTFYPALGAPSPATAGLTESPPLAGYVLTSSKGTASINLEIGERDPLLASWQRGLGRVTAWTSDATTRWAAQWMTWEEAVRFWGGVVSDVLPADDLAAPEAEIVDGTLSIVAPPGDAMGGTVTARVRTPLGETVVVPLFPEADGRWSGEAPAGTPGTYAVAVTSTATGTEQVVAATALLSGYSAEYAPARGDGGLAAAVTSTTGGRLDPAAADVFDETEAIGRAAVPIWPWLVSLALVLFAVDIVLRRLNLGGAEVVVASAVEVPEPPRAPTVPPSDAGADTPPPASSETMDRLLRRKRR